MNYQDIINNPAYTELASVKHDEIKPFLAGEISRNPVWARVANMYQLLGIFTFILGVFKAFMPFYAHREGKYLIALGAGLLFTFTVLIALHELIHALAYVCVGARKLSFGMKLRKFMFYVQADGEVLDYKQFRIVALAPAVLVTLLSVVGMALCYNQPLFYFFIPVLGLHSLFCGGDFGLLCFFQNRPDNDIVTFDLKKESTTYFYGKNK